MALLSKSNLRKARKEDVVRLARWLKLRNIDTMSHRQLINLLDWLFKRPILRMRNLITW
jgi:hypothetical protein